MGVIDGAMSEQREGTLLSDCEIGRISFAVGNSDAVSVEIDKADFVVVRRI